MRPLNHLATLLLTGTFSLWAASLPAVRVTVDRTVPGLAIAPKFVGLSYEKSVLYAPLFRADNAGLIALFKRLGPGILRVGANAVDKTNWDSTGIGLTTGTVSKPDIARLSDFLKATGWTAIYAVNLAHSNPALAASEAAAADSILGDRLEGLEIGNETDLYNKNGYRPTTWAMSDFKAEWDSFHVAMAARAPKVPFTGPATANPNAWTTSFAQTEASNISLLTFHYYLANGQDPVSTIGKLLAPNPARTKMLNKYDSLSKAMRIPGYRVAETNSYYNGGAPGVSSSYGSALWALDYLFTLASCDAKGVNFHGGGSGPGYTPIANANSGSVVQVRPEYYALSLFALASDGKLRSTTLSDSTNLASWTVDASDGTTRMVVLNTDTTASRRIVMRPGVKFRQIATTTLSGTHLDSSTGVTLGGSQIGTDGSWNPIEQPVASVSDSLEIDLAPASAKLVAFTGTLSSIEPRKAALAQPSRNGYDAQGRIRRQNRATGVALESTPAGQSRVFVEP